MVDSLFKVLFAGLSLWGSKERTKYLDEAIALKKAYYEEINKPFEERNNAALDDILAQLHRLTGTFSALVGEQNSGP